MFALLVIGAGVLIVVGLTVGLALFLDLLDDGVQPTAPRPERRNVDPRPFIDWGGTIAGDDR